MALRKPLLSRLIAAGMALALSALGVSPALGQQRDVPTPAIRALFIGIDTYKYSRSSGNARATFDNLKGAVGDARRFKQALRTFYKLDLDVTEEGKCSSLNAISITLTNECATRENVLRALAQQVNAAQPGETLLLYYAGHGTNPSEYLTSTQAGGTHGTMVPYDAMDPQGAVRPILDVEFRVFREYANARGINFVMVFDSCHSGTIGRDGTVSGLARAREIPVDKDAGFVRVAPPDKDAVAKAYRLIPPPSSPVSPGYWASLAAADDGEIAKETILGPEPAGVFTTGLIAALRDNPRATFADLVASARKYIAEQNFVDQHPKVESAIHESFVARGKGVALFEAVARDKVIEIAAGSLSGLTEGSEFAFYNSETEAQDSNAKPAVIGRIARLDAYKAQVDLVRPVSPPIRLVGVETRHNWGLQRIGVALRDPLPPGAEAGVLSAMLGKLEFVSLQGPFQTYLVGNGNALELRDAAGNLVRAFPNAAAGAYEEELGTALRYLLRSRMLLGMVPRAGEVQTAACVRPQAARAADCNVNAGATAAGKPSQVKLDKTTYTVTVRNLADDERYLYVLGISPDGLKVIPVLPPPGTDNKPVPFSGFITSDPFYFSKPGTWRFVTLSSPQPINTSALEQKGLASRDPAACATGPNPALCAAGSGNIDPNALVVPDWTAGLTEVVVSK